MSATAVVRREGIERLTANANWRIRQQLPFDILNDQSPDELVRFLDLWLHLRSNRGALPKRTELMPENLKAVGIIGRVHVLRCESGEPIDWYYSVYGSSATVLGGRDHTGKGPMMNPCRMYAEAALADYFTVRITGSPSIDLISANIEGSRRRYKRVIVPFGEDGRHVDALAIAFRFVPEDMVAHLVKHF